MSETLFWLLIYLIKQNNCWVQFKYIEDQRLVTEFSSNEKKRCLCLYFLNTLSLKQDLKPMNTSLKSFRISSFPHKLIDSSLQIHVSPEVSSEETLLTFEQKGSSSMPLNVDSL